MVKTNCSDEGKLPLLLDRLESQVVLLELVGQAGGGGVKLVRHIPARNENVSFSILAVLKGILYAFSGTLSQNSGPPNGSLEHPVFPDWDWTRSPTETNQI